MSLDKCHMGRDSGALVPEYLVKKIWVQGWTACPMVGRRYHYLTLSLLRNREQVAERTRSLLLTAPTHCSVYMSSYRSTDRFLRANLPPSAEQGNLDRRNMKIDIILFTCNSRSTVAVRWTHDAPMQAWPIFLFNFSGFLVYRFLFYVLFSFGKRSHYADGAYFFFFLACRFTYMFCFF